MIIADWVAIGLVAFFCLIGFIVGFGRGLQFFTSGFFGFIISVAFCYFLGGFVYKLSFVRQLLEMLNNALLAKNNGICNFLVTIHIDIIVYYIALFIIITIVRVIIVKIIRSVVEVDNVLLKFINRTLGMVLFCAVLAMITILVFHIIGLIGGSTASGFALKLAGSKFKLDALFANDPLVTIIKVIKLKIEIPA